jgi:hypothetical protein
MGKKFLKFDQNTLFLCLAIYPCAKAFMKFKPLTYGLGDLLFQEPSPEVNRFLATNVDRRHMTIYESKQ